MDELAVALKLDPVELRLKCYSDRDQSEDLPYTSKQLRECYARGAQAFGWSRRNPAPRSMRDGKELVGWGMARAARETLSIEEFLDAISGREGSFELVGGIVYATAGSRSAQRHLQQDSDDPGRGGKAHRCACHAHTR